MNNTIKTTKSKKLLPTPFTKSDPNRFLLQKEQWSILKAFEKSLSIKTMHLPSSLETLAQHLKKFPGVGTRTAERFVFDLLSWSKGEILQLANTLNKVEQTISRCNCCGCLQEDLHCFFCERIAKAPELLCIVGNMKDVYAIAATGEFQGRYHVLPKLLSPLDGALPEDLQVNRLLERIQDEQVEEIILAIDSTIEGDATALYLKEVLSPHSKKITRIASGVPMGSTLDYVDGATLAKAMHSRAQY